MRSRRKERATDEEKAQAATGAQILDEVSVVLRVLLMYISVPRSPCIRFVSLVQSYVIVNLAKSLI